MPVTSRVWSFVAMSKVPALTLIVAAFTPLVAALSVVPFVTAIVPKS